MPNEVPGSAILRTRGFSLIELLVSCAVVVIIIAFGLGGLSKSRSAARSVVCLSNQRQVLAAWHEYCIDYNSFPLRDSATPWEQLRWGWGGVHWRQMQIGPATREFPTDRPVNPYLGDAGATIEERSIIFRCPSDAGCYDYATGARSWDALAAPDTGIVDLQTCFGVAGTSYQANEWMYCVPQDQGFVFRGVGLPYRNFVGTNAPHSVIASASRFVVIGDIGAMSGGRLSHQNRQARNYWSGFWHGSEHGQLGFLDGSARRERMGAVDTPRYTFFMNPAKHTSGSKFNAYSW